MNGDNTKDSDSHVEESKYTYSREKNTGILLQGLYFFQPKDKGREENENNMNRE